MTIGHLVSEYELFMKAKEMDFEQLTEEYCSLMDIRKSGKERHFPDLQERLQIISAEGKSRGWVITYKRPEPKKPEFEPEIEMIPVESSAIHSIGFDELGKTLFIRFNSSDNVFFYSDISKKMFDDFLKSDSKGRFYGQYIRKKKSEIAGKAAGQA